MGNIFFVWLIPYAALFIFTAAMIFFFCRREGTKGKSLSVFLSVHIVFLAGTCGYFLGALGIKEAFAAAVMYITLMFLSGLLGFIIFIIADHIRYQKFMKKNIEEHGYIRSPLWVKKKWQRDEQARKAFRKLSPLLSPFKKRPRSSRPKNK